MRSRFLSAALAALSIIAFAAPMESARAQGTGKALVYCPIGIDEGGCNAIVSALGAQYLGGVDRGYDGSGGTMDLRTAELGVYSVFVVPSLADDPTAAPYALLRDPQIAQRLKHLLLGQIALWSGSPDIGSANRAAKDGLIRSLASWAGTNYASVNGPGLVALLDQSSNAIQRYDWLQGLVGLNVLADTEVNVYSSVRTLDAAGAAIVSPGGIATTYANLASFGFYLPVGGANFSLSAVGQTGTTVGGQVVLITSSGWNGGTAVIKTDKDDYVPHEATSFSGSGWQPGETVLLTLTEDPQIHDQLTFTTIADSAGNILFEEFRPDDHDAGVRFVLTAVGQSSGLRAQTTFTDAITVGPVATNNNGTGNASRELTINAPSVSVSDVLVAQIVITDAISSTFVCPPAGWTSIRRTTRDDKLILETFWFRASAAAGPTSYTWQFRASCPGGGLIQSNTKGASGGISLFTGVASSGSPVDVSGENSGSSSGPYNAPSVTTTTANAQILRFFGVFKNTNVTHGVTPRLYHIAGTNHKERAATFFNSGVQGAIGSTGTLTATLGSSAEFAAQTVALKDACVPSSITTQPVNQSITYGANALFTVAVAGTPAPTIQWQVSTNAGGSWSPLPGETNPTLTLVNPAVLQSGNQYRAVASSSCNTATSNAATLTVAPATPNVSVTAGTFTYDGTPKSATGFAYGVGGISDILVPAVTLSYAGTGSTTYGPGSTAPTNAGTYLVTASFAGNANYTTATGNAALTIEKANANIVVNGFTGTYDALPHGATGTATGVESTPANLTSLLDLGASFTNVPGGTANWTFNGANTNTNYNSTSGTAAIVINARTVTATVLAADKGYDGNATATITSCDVAPVQGSDDVDCTAASGAFDNKNAGVEKDVTASAIALTGTSAPNYQLASTTALTTADITARSLTVTATGINKVYDGTTTATVTLGDDRVVGDGLTQSYTATFVDKHVANGKTVNVAAIAISGGADQNNYTLANTTTTATADITPLAIVGSITAASKVYDGTTAATIATRTLSGEIGGDAVTYTGGTATFDTKHVGTGKTVTGVGLSLTGADAGNYTVNASASATADITQRALTITATGINKVYDGTSDATVTLNDDRASGDVFTDNYTSATFADKNVGANKPVTVSGISITGADAGNYTFNATASTNADITQRALAITAAGVDKIYDGTSDATVTLADDRVVGDVFTDGYTTATFADKHVGTGKVVSVSGISITGTDAGNYTFNTTTTTAANITVRAITVTAATDSRIYDATTNSAGVPTVTDGTIVSGDNGTFTQSFDTKNVGTNKTLTPAGSVADGNSGNNYNITFAPVATGSIAPIAITGSITAANKVYDATTTATILTRTLATVLGTDDVSYVGGSATFADKNVANGKTVSATGLSLGGGDAANYTVNTTATTTADITALAITGSITADDKEYDGNTTATIATRTLSGQISGDAVTYTGGTATFDNKNVGTGKTVTGVGLSLSGGDAGNYTVNASAMTTADITARALTITATGVSKVYDGNTTATVTLADNRVAGDVFTDNYSSATFADKNVGTNKPVSVSGISITGTDAGNYTFNTTASANADITQRPLAITATGIDKIYDGTTTAAVTLNDDRVGGDALTLGYSADFNTRHVGTGKPVSVSAITLTGADAGNYTFNTTTSTTADITARAITVTAATDTKVYDATTSSAGVPTVTTGTIVSGDNGNFTQTFDTKHVATNKTLTPAGAVADDNSGNNYTITFTPVTTGTITTFAITGHVTAANKVYDGNATASITTRTLTGVFGGDDVSYVGGSATFADKNVANGKTVTATGLSLSGGDAGNYSVNDEATATADITHLAITGSITADDKVYDGNNTATIATRTLSGQISGDAVSYVGGTATFSDKNVENGKTVTATGLSLNGGDAGNYTVNATATTSADITARPLTITATGINKTYDGNATATVTLNDDRVSGDALTLGYTASFADKIVGTGKPVSVTGMSVSGTDAGNYSFNATTSTNADITPRALTITATGINKIYDGTTTATVTLADDRVTGDVFTDGTTTATFNNKNVGTGKPVSVSGISITGVDATNYTVNATATTTADITARELTITASGVNKIYDGTVVATVTLADDRVAGDVFTDGYTTATFNNKNVGTGKPVSVSALSISGTDAGNYTFNTTASTSADITTRALTVSAAGINKVYDANTLATVTLSDNRVAGDVFTDSYTTATFADKNVGNGKAVSVGGISISGTDAGNYTFNATTATTADITPRPLTVDADDKTMNFGGTPPTFTATTSNFAPGENLANLTGTVQFTTAPVNPITTTTFAGVYTITPLGVSSPNYTVSFTTGTLTVFDTSKPIVSNTLVNPNPVALNTPMTLTANISDAVTGGSNISSACYQIDTGNGPGACVPMTGAFGQVSVNVTATIPGKNVADVFEVCVYGTDSAGNTSVKMDCVLVAVYDPSAGFITGGGWITSPVGAYPTNPALTGKATFGFVAKYKKGQQTPEGNTEFQFHAADMNFKSTSYEWLVVAGIKAQYKGVGTVNGAAGYGFLLTALDGDLSGNKKPDTFRMKVWRVSDGSIVYDNNIGVADTGDPATTLGGGSIVIHNK